jgi:hypothetical protein
MTTGTSAALTVTFTGVTASPFNSEVDLAIDAAGDLLEIDPAGDPLIVTGAITFTGGTATLIVPDVSETLEGEAWSGLALEDGRILVTEGS